VCIYDWFGASSPKSSASAICRDWHSTGSTRSDYNWTMKFCSQRTTHMEPSASSTMVTRPVGKHLQAGTEHAPVLDRPAPLRYLHNSGAGYKYPDLLTYLSWPGRRAEMSLLLFLLSDSQSSPLRCHLLWELVVVTQSSSNK